MTRCLALAILLATATPTLARDEDCLAAMHERVQACANECVAKARAAVDPSMRDTVIGRACAKNCLKIEMFRGAACS
jgi:hypothetical protein